MFISVKLVVSPLGPGGTGEEGGGFEGRLPGLEGRQLRVFVFCRQASAASRGALPRGDLQHLPSRAPPSLAAGELPQGSFPHLWDRRRFFKLLVIFKLQLT